MTIQLGTRYASPVKNAQELNKVLQIYAVAFKGKAKSL